MPVNRVVAGIAVADVVAALPWYELLFGRPADELPMEGWPSGMSPPAGWSSSSRAPSGPGGRC
jgi:hypothetical protein